MRFISIIFILIITIGAAGQSPAVSKLFSDGTRLANAGRYSDALESYKRARLVADREHLDTGYRARLHYNVGVCYFHLERFDLAVTEFKAAVLLKTDYAQAYYALGMAKMRKRDWKAAQASFESVLKFETRNGEAWFDLALANLALGDVDRAADAFERAIELGSVDAALGHNNIGVIQAMRGEFESAEERFENAISLSGGVLVEAKRNLEFCRSRRQGERMLIAQR